MSKPKGKKQKKNAIKKKAREKLQSLIDYAINYGS